MPQIYGLNSRVSARKLNVEEKNNLNVNYISRGTFSFSIISGKRYLFVSFHLHRWLRVKVIQFNWLRWQDISVVKVRNGNDGNLLSNAKQQASKDMTCHLPQLNVETVTAQPDVLLNFEKSCRIFKVLPRWIKPRHQLTPSHRS